MWAVLRPRKQIGSRQTRPQRGTRDGAGRRSDDHPGLSWVPTGAVSQRGQDPGVEGPTSDTTGAKHQADSVACHTTRPYLSYATSLTDRRRSARRIANPTTRRLDPMIASGTMIHPPV